MKIAFHSYVIISFNRNKRGILTEIIQQYCSCSSEEEEIYKMQSGEWQE